MPLVLRNAAITALLGLAAYSLGGFFVVPHLAVRWVEETALDGHGLRARIGDAAFNPFTLAVSFSDITVSGRESLPPVSLARASGVLAASSFFSPLRSFNGPVAFEELRVEGAAGEPLLRVPAGFATGVTIDSHGAGMRVEALALPGAEVMLQYPWGGPWRIPGWLAALADAGVPARDIEVTDGTLWVRDSATGVSRVDAGLGFMASVTADEDGGIRAEAASTSGDGRARFAVRQDAGDAGFPASVHVDIDNLPAGSIEHYAVEAAALRPLAGTVSLSASASRRTDAIAVVSMFTLDNLQWDAVPASDDQVPLSPSEAATALALLQDGKGRAVLPGRYLLATPRPGEEHIRLLTEQAVQSLAELAANPFAELARVSAWNGADLSAVAFATGSAQMDAGGIDGLRALGRAMLRRPKVGVAIWPGYDSIEDRRALARQQVAQHVALATSIAAAGGSGAAIDPDDPRVRTVLDEFAENRLTTVQQAMIVGQFHATRSAYYAAVLDALVDNEVVKPSAVRRLARYRAQAVVRELRALGIDSERLQVAADTEQLNADEGAVVLRLEAFPVSNTTDEPGGPAL
ncbi:MAG: hypothetical protein AAFN78_05230 [Pseudomonadota bacterium]